MFEIFFFFFFQKFAGLWLVGKVDNHVAIYGSKVAEGFSAFQRRLVIICIHHFYQIVPLIDYEMIPFISDNE